MRVIKASRGSAEDMLQAFRAKLDDMGVNSCSTVQADTHDDMYCQDLQDSISSEVEREVDDIAYRCTDNSMIITVTYMGRILEFNVPNEDLTGDLSSDTAYIVNTIVESLDEVD